MDFNQKILCKQGTYKDEMGIKSFICDITNKPCKFCRYCRTDRCYKMLPNNDQCKLKK